MATADVTETELLEQLADLEHASWARWMAYLFTCCQSDGHGNLVIPVNYVVHWQRQIETGYGQLTVREQYSDRQEVLKILPIVQRYARAVADAAVKYEHEQGEEAVGGA